MRLHYQFKNSLQYHYSIWLQGYDMFTLGNYPYAVSCDNLNHKILVEVMHINDPEVAETIHQIEIEAGYFAKQIKLGNELLTLYLFEKPANNLRIDSGDWVIFFGD